MQFTVRNTEKNLKNAEFEALNGNLTFELSSSKKMIIISPITSCFPYLTTEKQFRKTLDF